MASVSDVRYTQLQYEENRRTGEGIRKYQDGLDQKRGRMGLGRSLLSFVGGAIGAAGGPVGMAVGAGLGSALGSFLGAKSVKIDEVDKGKLYKGTVDEVRRQGRGALEQMNNMAVRGIASDAFSAFVFAGTDIGKAAQTGATGKVAGLGADANLLQKAWASGSGAVGGGAGHIKASIAEMQNEAFKGTFAGDLEGTLADTATVDPMMAKPTASRLTPESFTTEGMLKQVPKNIELPPALSGDLGAFEGSAYTGQAAWQPGDDPGIGRRLGDVVGNDVSTKGTWQVGQDPGGRLGGIAQSNVAGKTMPQQLSPLSDAMQHQGPSISGAPGAGVYDPSIQDVALSSWDQPGYQEAMAKYQAENSWKRPLADATGGVNLETYDPSISGNYAGEILMNGKKGTGTITGNMSRADSERIRNIALANQPQNTGQNVPWWANWWNN